MKGKIAFVLGAAVGYVLGTRAGRERYEQIKQGAQRVWETEPVQKGVGVVRDALDDRADDLKVFIRKASSEAFAAFARQTAPKPPAGTSTASTSRTTRDASTSETSTAKNDSSATNPSHDSSAKSEEDPAPNDRGEEANDAAEQPKKTSSSASSAKRGSSQKPAAAKSTSRRKSERTQS